MINGISTAIDQRETSVSVFLDLSKAFDTIDNEILFAKLEHYGIRNVALQWIKSYFSYRRQSVQINQTCSSTQTIKCGVPQGPILGSLLLPGVMKTGSANLNFLCNFSQLPLSNISLFTMLLTADVGFFRFF